MQQWWSSTEKALSRYHFSYARRSASFYIRYIIYVGSFTETLKHIAALKYKRLEEHVAVSEVAH